MMTGKSDVQLQVRLLVTMRMMTTDGTAAVRQWLQGQVLGVRAGPETAGVTVGPDSPEWSEQVSAWNKLVADKLTGDIRWQLHVASSVQKWAPHLLPH
jgi:hypothetical protein